MHLRQILKYDLVAAKIQIILTFMLQSSGISCKSAVLTVRYSQKKELFFSFCFEKPSIALNFGTTGSIQVGYSATCTTGPIQVRVSATCTSPI